MKEIYMKPIFHLPWQNKIESVEIKLVKKAIAGDSKEIRVVVEKFYVSKYGETLSEIILNKVIPLP